MSDIKRKRFRKSKPDEKHTIILTKRYENEKASRNQETEKVQPKRLLIIKPYEQSLEETVQQSNISTYSQTGQLLPKDIIKTRSEKNNEIYQLFQWTSSCPQKELTHKYSAQYFDTSKQTTRSKSISNINSNVRMQLIKDNSDFIVVGIVGTQGIGKSTTMNFLANCISEKKCFKSLFEINNVVFPTKMNDEKGSVRKTSATNIFITTDRIILLDSAPILCNANSNGIIGNEIDDLHNIMRLYSVCHLIIVMQEEVLNLNVLRLLQLAELMTLKIDKSLRKRKHLPTLLFLQNRYSRREVTSKRKEQIDNLLRHFFKHSEMQVFTSYTMEKQNNEKYCVRLTDTFDCIVPERAKPLCNENNILFGQIIKMLKEKVFMAPRKGVIAYNELTEIIWFDLLTKTSHAIEHFLVKAYEQTHNQHLHPLLNINAVNCNN